MTPVNTEIVTRLFTEMEQAVAKLRSSAALSQDEFLSDSKYYDSAKYNLIVAVEALIDLCNHIIAQERLGKPEEYADVLRIIGARLSLGADFMMRLEKMAKFRNLIVHLYWKVDNADVYKILKNNMDDFDIIKKALSKYMTHQGKK
ncbi:MAG: DUF86 domain-containing protein [Deltaproteobacteria bacterium]|nr:DUF86 domain-containing protein [Deltaproteobacteria bacterium]